MHLCVDNNAFVVDNLVSYFFLLGYKKNLVKDMVKLVGGNVIHFTATIETKVGKDLKVYFHFPLRLWQIR